MTSSDSTGARAEQIFCFVDLAGFSALTEVHGDETGADLVERFTRTARDVLVGNDELVATVGDAIFLVFDEASACLAILEWLWRRTEEEPNFPALRAGVHQGKAVRRGQDFYGTAVNIAARVAAQARGGQVLGTQAIAAAAGKLNLRVRSLGVVALKNLRKPLELFAIGITTSDGPEVIDPVCRRGQVNRWVNRDQAANLRGAGLTAGFTATPSTNFFPA